MSTRPGRTGGRSINEVVDAIEAPVERTGVLQVEDDQEPVLLAARRTSSMPAASSSPLSKAIDRL